MKLRTSLIALTAVALAACGSSSGGPAGAATVSPPPDSELFTAGTLTIGSDISYPPQEFYDPPGSNTPTGFDIDLGKALADKMGLKFAAINQSFDGIIPSLETKKYDVIISAMTIKPERAQKVDFIPYFIAGESFVVKKGASYQPKRLEDLCGHKVAVEDGTAEKDEVNDALNADGMPCAGNKVQLSTFKVDTEALTQLKKDAVDVHFTDSPVAGYETVKDKDLVISNTEGPIEVAPEGIAVRKNSAILEPLKKAFQALRDDGSYKKLLEKWGVVDGDIANNKA